MNTQLLNYKDFKAYDNKKVIHIAGDTPIVIRVACAAAAKYPDLYSIEDANNLHQEFVDKFFGGKYKVSELKFIVTQEDIESHKSA